MVEIGSFFVASTTLSCASGDGNKMENDNAMYPRELLDAESAEKSDKGYRKLTTIVRIVRAVLSHTAPTPPARPIR